MFINQASPQPGKSTSTSPAFQRATDIKNAQKTNVFINSKTSTNIEVPIFTPSAPSTPRQFPKESIVSSQPQQNFLQTVQTKAAPIIGQALQLAKETVKQVVDFIPQVPSYAKAAKEKPLETVAGAGEASLTFFGSLAGIVQRGIASVAKVNIPERWDITKQTRALRELDEQLIRKDTKTAGELIDKRKAFETGRFVGSFLPYALGSEVAAASIGSKILLPTAEKFLPGAVKFISTINNAIGFMGVGQIEHDPEHGSRVDRFKNDLIMLGLFEVGGVVLKGLTKGTKNLISKTTNEVKGKKTVVMEEVEPQIQEIKVAIKKDTGQSMEVVVAKQIAEGKPKPIVSKPLQPLAEEARKYKSAKEFVEDYGKISREISRGKPSAGALGEYTSEGKIRIKTKGLSKEEIKEVIGHEQKHQISEKIMGYFIKKGPNGFDKEFSRVEKIIKKMGKVVAVETKGEIDIQIFEQFTYNNKEFAKRLPELHKYLIDYVNLRKQAQSIPDLTDFYIQATGGIKPKGIKIETKPKEVKPIGEGETKVSTLGLRVEQTAIEKKLVKELGDLPEYKQLNMKDQATKAGNLINSDPDKAMRIALGQELPPEGLLKESIFKAVEESITTPEMARRLASSPLVSESTALGQRIKALDVQIADSPVGAMKQVIDARKKVIEGRYGNVDKATERVTKDIQSKVKIPSKWDWNKFIEGIQC